jgi:hypothetical protein
MNQNQPELEQMVHEVLGDSYVALEVRRYQLQEDIREGHAQMVCQLHVAGQDAVLRSVEGNGVGLIDALFNGLKSSLSDEYPSLNHIHFVDFAISGDFQTKSRTAAHTDVMGNVTLAVQNSEGHRFSFQHASVSISASSVAVVVDAVEHFVNAELAVLKVYDWIEDARERNRAQLVDRYTQRLADLVKNASYSETIDRRKS